MEKILMNTTVRTFDDKGNWYKLTYDDKGNKLSCKICKLI